ncbi:TPA: hypothetical protein OLB72_004088, partial [Acinetobacter baumannii]|nr:hypothetical protein [Acinetobacter baumannii]
MQLLGSVASPFVRRLRLVLAGQPYQFVALNIFESEGRSVLVQQALLQIVGGDKLII